MARGGGPGHGPERGQGHADLQETGPTLIYGRNPVREALRGRREVHAILLASVAGGELDRELETWLRATAPGRAGGHPAHKIERLSACDLTARLGTPDHQDIAALVDAYPYVDEGDLLRTHTLLIALDQVQDPHNLGAIIRTAEGAGAGVLIPRHRAAEITGAVVKASAGATEHAQVARVRNLADFLEVAKKAGFWTYGAAAEAKDGYTSQDYTYPTCFVVGSEGEGLGRRVASLCDVLVSLPQAGRVSSLNVSVSAGILLYEAVRQRTPGPGATGRAGHARTGPATGAASAADAGTPVPGGRGAARREGAEP